MNKRAMFLAMSLIFFPFSLAHSDSMKKIEVAAVKAEGAAKISPQPQFLSQYQLYAAACKVGPRSGDAIITCYGIGFPADNPYLVQCQTRNSSSDPRAYPDQFACQVVDTSPGAVTVRIRRLDGGSQYSIGWGQDLYVNLLIYN